jgi:hypothetical protein
MRNLKQAVGTVLASVCFACVSSVAVAADIHTTPPPKFKKVSTLVKLPEYLPGLGVLYVDPATLPVGPFLGYDKKGHLVNVTYMVPLKDLDEHKSFAGLAAGLGNLKIDHTDIVYNPGHPGVEEPHYHVINWLLTTQRQDADLR